jgi:putative transposase
MKPQFDPKRHHRRSIRLPGYDYGSAGAYFVTLCTHQRDLLFEDPLLRRVVETLWQRIPRHFPHVRLDEWVVMPNHIHGILVITDDPRRGEASPATDSHAEPAHSGETLLVDQVSPRDASPPLVDQVSPRDASPLPQRPGGLSSGSLGALIGNFKSVTARRINRLRRTPGAPVWQRNYYEHIVRDEHALNAIRQYIADNPARWAWDTYNPVADGPDPHATGLWRLSQGRGIPSNRFPCRIGSSRRDRTR